MILMNYSIILVKFLRSKQTLADEADFDIQNSYIISVGMQLETYMHSACGTPT